MSVAATMNPSIATASPASEPRVPPNAARPGPTLQWISPPGRLRAADLPDTDRNLSLLMHLALVLGMFVPVAPMLAAPAFVLIAWLAKRDESPFVDDHGREVLNMMLSGVIFSVVLAITVIGVLPLLAWYVVMLINTIRGAIAASRSEYFRYPMILRLL